MKGVVKTMEVLLDHLLDVHEDRIKSDETEFESTKLFEEALVRALPQLAQAHEGIEDVQILRHFLNALSINTSGKFKSVMRKTKFARDFEGFQKARVASKAPIWAFIISQIFTTLPRESIDALIEKIPKAHDPNQILCLSISHLQQYLFSPQQHDRPTAAEIERCTLFWNLHEYICATWPKRDSEILTLIGNLLVKIIASPVPRVDIALFVAFAETLYHRKQDKSLGTPPVIQGYHLLASQDERFRWHQHKEFFDHVDIASQFGGSSWSGTGAELLEIDPDRFRGAILHRAVCHPDEEKRLIMMEELLGNHMATDVHFTNEKGQSTLLVATIFSQSISTIELLLNAGADINKGDRFGATPLIIASVLRKSHLREFLLGLPDVDVNLESSLTSAKVKEMGLGYADLSEPLNSTKAKFCSFDSSLPLCKNLGCPHCTVVEESLAMWYTRGHEWPELEEIIKHSTFAILKSFRTWDQFLDCIAIPDLTDSLRMILLEKAITFINMPDSTGRCLLGAVLRHAELSSNRELVQRLLNAHADVSLAEPGLRKLAPPEKIETFLLVIKPLLAHQLMVTDNWSRALLHWLCYAWPSHSYDPEIAGENFRQQLQFSQHTGADSDQARDHSWTPRLIFIILKDRRFEECRKLLPPLAHGPPIEEAQFLGAVKSAIQRGPPRWGRRCIEFNGLSVSRHPLQPKDRTRSIESYCHLFVPWTNALLGEPMDEIFMHNLHAQPADSTGYPFVSNAAGARNELTKLIRTVTVVGTW